MCTTTSISTKYLLFTSFLLNLLLTGCGPSANDSSREKQSEYPSSKKTSQQKQEAEKPEKLTEDNAADFLKKYAQKRSTNRVVIKSQYGEITIRLYDDTPYHRANFLYLTNHNYFDDTWFYRVSKDHVVQAGNTDSPKTVKKRRNIGDYKVPSEIDVGHYHKYGAVAAARSYYQNPEKNSDPFEFYIVLGKAYNRKELKLLAEKHDLNFSEAQLDFYESKRGAPHLDGQHTVFGEVVDGMDVVEQINKVEVDEGEWPLMNIPIDVEIVK